jgi:membrane protease YdiL (CAAX protease family)
MSTASKSTHLEYLQRTLQDPRNPNNWLMLGWTTKDPHAALEFFQEALTLNPNDPSILDSIAWAKSRIENHGDDALSPDTNQAIREFNAIRETAVQESAAEELPAIKKVSYWRVLVSRKMLRLWMGLYLTVITLAEILTTALPTVELGLIIYGLALLLLIVHSALVVSRREQRLLLTLAFAPLIRMISLSIPLRDLPQMFWYLVIGVPLFAAAIMMMRYAGFSLKEIGITNRRWPVQLFIGLLGIGLGYLEYLILRPEPLVAEFSLQAIWFPAFVLLFFTGLLEEFIFRGLMQRAFSTIIGAYEGILVVSFVFAILHFGYHSVIDIIFVFWVAVIFGLIAYHTGSILGVTLAHGLTNIGLFIVFPFLVSLPASTPTTATEATVSSTPGIVLTVTPTPFQPLSAYETPFETATLIEIQPLQATFEPSATPPGAP